MSSSGIITHRENRKDDTDDVAEDFKEEETINLKKRGRRIVNYVVISKILCQNQTIKLGLENRPSIRF